MVRNSLYQWRVPLGEIIVLNFLVGISSGHVLGLKLLILLFILNKTKLLILGVVTYLLDAIFDRDNEINNPINTIDPNRIHESGKPETFTNTEWNMQNMDKNE